jgi:uncharacterized protein (TIGR00369 family)
MQDISEEYRGLLTEISSQGKYPPFLEFLGIMIEPLDTDNINIKLAMRDELRGYPGDGALHGGVIAAMIDIIGGTVVAWKLLKEHKGQPWQELAKRFKNMSTVDLRVDYLRPGKGEVFTATASVLRTGKKLAVTRMEIYNEENRLIAVGTGTYTVG